VRKIANIRPYGMSNQSHNEVRSMTPEALHFAGFERNLEGAFISHANQFEILQTLIGTYLGSNYAWCRTCKIYRLKRKSWWKDFSEYESPGINKVSEETEKKIDDSINGWATQEPIPASSWDVLPCPAHTILAERKGARTILEPPKKAEKVKKGQKRRRRYDSDEDSD
jgi:hypothetical protein